VLAGFCLSLRARRRSNGELDCVDDTVQATPARHKRHSMRRRQPSQEKHVSLRVFATPHLFLLFCFFVFFIPLLFFIFLFAGILILPHLLPGLARGAFNRTGHVDDAEQQGHCRPQPGVSVPHRRAGIIYCSQMRTIRILSVSHLRRNARRLQFFYLWHGQISGLAQNRVTRRRHKNFQ
jgi:hypothetical protein